MAYQVPILIIAFNRPEVSKATFKVIKDLRPTVLYVAIDGARNDVNGEADKVAEVINIYKEIDWPCNVFYKCNFQNLGAEITVSNAVSWVLGQQEYCVVLEDDILASRSFFDFAAQMLEKYKDEERVYQISAAQFTPMESMKTDYVFSLYGHTGFGWATWRRAWQHFTMNITDFDETLANCDIRKYYSSIKAYKSFLNRTRKMKAIGSNNCSWDYCWSYIRCRDGGLSIVPRCNLAQNIGIMGLHAHGRTKYHEYRANDDFVVKRHPSPIVIDFTYDDYHFTKYLYHGVIEKVINKIKNLIR